ncbi:lytic transglycosylase domain-containing protein [Azohydromonas lata]|uniref:Transglycosylase SLT domain-containing protein n=1 Tax=Azohydromonas lata TaxID=45677 RepID=A0ABU5IPP8_9BURK|nr:transglycosylase SLT domain-containing protein [Azohydromonas lata]MDZ5460847.1 transglycosylase SLT domain-containing protein [Azohydromonas lata]
MNRHFRLAALSLALLSALPCALPAAHAQSGDDIVVEARDALRKRDRMKLAAARSLVNAEQHPLASWVEYWELGNRLAQATTDEVEAFYARWSGTYVEDRLRNDWLLELGRRRDWSAFSRDYPRFRMNDDREVSCYALLSDHLAGKDVREAAREAWFAQRDLDDGCHLLASTLVRAGVFSTDEIWQKVRLAAEGNRPKAAMAAAALLNVPGLTASVSDAFSQPPRYLARKASAGDRTGAELTALALARAAASDPESAATLAQDWQNRLPPQLAGWVWGQVGLQGALKLLPQASEWYLRAGALAVAPGPKVAWSEDMLAWQARAALRGSPQRWALVRDAVDAMPSARQREPVWVYWKSRAVLAEAVRGADGDPVRQQAQQALAGIATGVGYYGKLAAEELGRKPALPPTPQPLSKAEREAANANPGLSRALQLIDIGLRNEGVREWNFTLRGMDDRALLAAAQRACEREVWDRCINTSEKTRDEIDMNQRFPMPHRQAVLREARAIGLDPAYVYGLIRQESRFITDARSHVGASGLMQVMPATARWTAKKLGIPYSGDLITDRDTNLKIGTGYLKLVLDSFEGHQALAAAAYNAGPGRPRRWSEGGTLEAAVWAESIPFNETRDYVQKVLSNAVDYAALIAGQPMSLKSRLGATIGPGTRAPDAELP